MTQPDDAELVLAAQAGDAAALGMLLDRHRARMKAVAVGLLGARGDIEDVVQDACLQAVRRITDVRDPDAAGRWLVSIVANACRARLRRPPVEAATDDADMLHGAANSVDDAVERAALRDWVWTALGRLPESLRLAVVLRYFSTASSYEAIAAVCGVPVGTVRSRLHAARAQLAEELLATVAARHDDAVAYQRHARDIAEAMLTFYRSGDRSHLAGHLARDLRFALADRVERQGLDLYASLLASDVDDGVQARVVGLTGGSDLAVFEVRLDNPPEHPDHCPLVLTQVHVHDGAVTRRLLNYYASAPPETSPPACAPWGTSSSS